ncbi:MAG: cytochrome c biogenesis protein CcsA, partial [Pseudomonadota bacterium]|nr:cytochrome c biogenesis protein CcsA [Pseudomonadota bacterium]
QHLIHKTVLTVIAWIVYGILTTGHFRHGWRVNTAVMLCASGFALLTLGFYGSKLVLELVLN